MLPQTLGYSLLDSPAGLAAWLDEALVGFSDTRPEAGGGLSVAQRLDDIALSRDLGDIGARRAVLPEAVLGDLVHPVDQLGDLRHPLGVGCGRDGQPLDHGHLHAPFIPSACVRPLPA